LNTKLRNLRNARSDGGFTLVELLIVIVVLGVLAGITVFGVAKFKDDATASACAASAKTVTVAAQAYNAQKAKYPADVAALISGGYLDSDPGAKVSYDSTTGTAKCV
jgi:general secretion pathway protein G